MYSVIAHASENIRTEYGENAFDWTKDDLGPENRARIVENFVKPYFKVIKFCGEERKDCFPADYYYLNGKEFPFEEYSYFVLSDGTSVRLADQYYASNGAMIALTFDTNGLKGPNIIGKDIYEIKINSKGVYVNDGMNEKLYSRDYLLSDIPYQCNKKSENGGYGCIALIIRDGWEIKDDYPW